MESISTQQSFHQFNRRRGSVGRASSQTDFHNVLDLWDRQKLLRLSLCVHCGPRSLRASLESKGAERGSYLAACTYCSSNLDVFESRRLLLIFFLLVIFCLIWKIFKTFVFLLFSPFFFFGSFYLLFLRNDGVLYHGRGGRFSACMSLLEKEGAPAFLPNLSA